MGGGGDFVQKRLYHIRDRLMRRRSQCSAFRFFTSLWIIAPCILIEPYPSETYLEIIAEGGTFGHGCCTSVSLRYPF